MESRLARRPQRGHQAVVFRLHRYLEGADWCALTTLSVVQTRLRRVRLWDVATLQPRGEPLTGHTNTVYGVAFSPDGKLLATASGDQTVRQWATPATWVKPHVRNCRPQPVTERMGTPHRRCDAICTSVRPILLRRRRRSPCGDRGLPRESMIKTDSTADSVLVPQRHCYVRGRPARAG